MKTTSKYNLKKIVTKSGALLALILLMPLSSLALESSKTESGSNSSSAFCTNFSTESSKITSKMSEQATKLTTAWNKQNDGVKTRSQENDQKITDARAKSDTTRNTNFTTLESKTTNDAQTQAEKSYEAAVNSAITARRASYDAAKTTFHTALQSAIDAKQGSVSSQLSSFTSAVNTAISTAKASCSSSPNSGSTIRETFKASLKSAKSTFLSGRSSDANLGGQVKQFVTTRNASFKAADTAFQSAMTSARDSLKIAFTKTN